MAVYYFQFFVWVMAFLVVLGFAALIAWILFCVEMNITFTRNRLYVIITIREDDDTIGG